MRTAIMKRVVKFCEDHNMTEFRVSRNRMARPLDGPMILYTIYAKSANGLSSLKLDVTQCDKILLEKTHKLNIEEG